jgi:hypothetical protein
MEEFCEKRDRGEEEMSESEKLASLIECFDKGPTCVCGTDRSCESLFM